MRIRAWRAVEAEIGRGAAAYRRERHLAALVPELVWRTGTAGIGRESAIEALEAALRRERSFGRMGDSRYRLNRHIALIQALTAERAGTPPSTKCV